MDLVARARLASGAGTLSGPGLTAVATGQLDPHFRPQFMLCELHAIRYDFIGDADIKEHTDYISDRLGLGMTYAEYAAQHGDHGGEQGLGREQEPLACREHTVVLVEQLYAADIAILGHRFDDAHTNCGRYFQTVPPRNAGEMSGTALHELKSNNRATLGLV